MDKKFVIVIVVFSFLLTISIIISSIALSRINKPIRKIDDILQHLNQNISDITFENGASIMGKGKNQLAIRGAALDVSSNSLSYFPGITRIDSSTIMTTQEYRNGHQLQFTGDANQTITFPDPTTCPGYTFFLFNNSGNALMVSTNSERQILYYTTGSVKKLSNLEPFQIVTCQSDGINWIVFGGG